MRLLIILFLIVVGCQKTLPPDPYPFIDGPKSEIFIDASQDNNGYYLVDIDSSVNFNRFNIYIGANEVIDFYQYGGQSVIEATFDCDSYFILGILQQDLTIHLPLYSPFGSKYSNKTFSKPYPVGDTAIILNQFRDFISPLVQDDVIYLKEYFDGDIYKPQDEFQPTIGNYWSKRIVGPIPGVFEGDTITIYCKILWEAGNYSYNNPEEMEHLKEIKVIFK